MEWSYGLSAQEKAFGTVVKWSGRGWGVCSCSNFGTSPPAHFWLREKEIMFPCGQYFVPTDDVAKSVGLGDVMECQLVEIEDGLIGLGARKVNEIDASALSNIGTMDQMPYIPRLIGVVKHWNFEQSFGFLKSDTVRADLFFHRREVMVPYETLDDPSLAVTFALTTGNLVTFDSVSTPRGMRALAISRWKGDGRDA